MKHYSVTSEYWQVFNYRLIGSVLSWPSNNAFMHFCVFQRSILIALILPFCCCYFLFNVAFSGSSFGSIFTMKVAGKSPALALCDSPDCTIKVSSFLSSFFRTFFFGFVGFSLIHYFLMHLVPDAQQLYAIWCSSSKFLVWRKAVVYALFFFLLRRGSLQTNFTLFGKHLKRYFSLVIFI